MNGVAPPLGLMLTLTDNSAFATTPPSVQVPNGATQATLTIPTLPVTSARSVVVTASVPQGFKTGVFVIVPAP